MTTQRTPESIPGHSRAKQLLQAFYEGSTSLADEESLYAYFMQPEALIAPDLRHERGPLMMMAGMDESDATPQYAAAAESGPTAYGTLPHIRRRSAAAARLVQWLTVAAMIAVIVTGAWRGIHVQRQLDTTRAVYAGSYVMRQGERITDLATIVALQAATESRLSRAQAMISADAAGLPADNAEIKACLEDAFSDRPLQ